MAAWCHQQLRIEKEQWREERHRLYQERGAEQQQWRDEKCRLMMEIAELLRSKQELTQRVAMLEARVPPVRQKTLSELSLSPTTPAPSSVSLSP